MLLEITTTHQPATDLGYLLYKHPQRVQQFDTTFGKVHVFYPQATVERCTAALLLDIDPIRLTRGRRGQSDFALQPYVNDRLYAASSFLSVAISNVLGSALNGRCQERPALVETPIPLEAKLAVLPCRGGESFLRALFEPLGYTVDATAHPLDPAFAEWGRSPYYTVRLAHTLPLKDLLTHLYVLVPVLDDQKHYWVDEGEVEKLLQRGGDWLRSHPAQEQIVNRYLRHQRRLTRAALAQLVEESDPDATAEISDAEETIPEEKIGLHRQRMEAVMAAIRDCGARSVVDLGCGEGILLRLLLREKQIERIAGVDISAHRLEIAAARLRLDQMPDAQRQRLVLIHSSLTYRDERLAGFDAAAVVEVIEHLDPPRLAAFEQALFAAARPATIIITTPNREYNVLWPTLPAGRLRHRDHRFEWTRAEFQQWAEAVAARHGYTVTCTGIGPEDEIAGAPSQMGVFRR